MAENSGIEWTHHTFNPWVGCTKVSPACDHCYAETWAKRSGQDELWKGERRLTKTWGMPVKWNKEAAARGIRFRVFCASLADVFDNQVPEEWRADLWALIRSTPHLDWLLLTKRPQNIKKMLPPDWGDGYLHVWLGMTVENQTEYDRRAAHFYSVPAFVRFLSMEPLLGNVDLRLSYEPRAGVVFPPDRLNWVITGGESGSHFRSANPDWFRSLRDQCAAHRIPFLFKQWEGSSQKVIKALGRELDGVVHDGYPEVRTL